MKFKKFLLMLLLITTMVVGASASESIDIYDVTNDCWIKSDTIPEIKRNFSVSDGSLFVTYSVDKIAVSDSKVYQGTKVCALAGFGTMTGEGNPAILQRLERFEVGNNANAEISIADCEYKTIDAEISPAIIESFENAPILKNTTTTTGFYPVDVMSDSAVKGYKHTNILQYYIYPIQYNNDTKELRIYTNITLKIDLAGNESAYALDNFYETSYKSYDEIQNCDNFINLVDVVCNSQLGDATLDGIATQAIDIPDITISTYDEFKSEYLIITVDELYSSISEFVKWKKTLGFDVTVQSKPKWTTRDVGIEIQCFYESHPNLDYVLIVGGSLAVPFGIGFSPDDDHIKTGINSDVKYVYREADALPFASIGRIPATSPYEVLNAFSKIIKYEKEPSTDPMFYSSGLHCAYFQDDNRDSVEDRRFVKTSEDIATLLNKKSPDKTVSKIYYAKSNVSPLRWNPDDYCDGGLMPPELWRTYGFNWNGSPSDIVKKWDTGNFYTLYRGHGSEEGWESISFMKEHLKKLSSQQTNPIVFSITCSTGAFNYSKRCFADSLITIPNAGASLVIASTRPSYSGPNDVLIYGMFDAVWPYSGLKPNFGPVSFDKAFNRFGEYRISKIFEYGMRHVDNLYVDGKARSTRLMFHIFGDPSMYFRTEVPTDGQSVMTLSDNGTVSSNNNKAIISVYNEKTDEVHSYTKVVSLPVDDIDNCLITVSGPNIKPYTIIGAMTSEAPSKILSYEIVNNNQVRIKYHLKGNETNGLITYTPILPVAKNPSTYVLSQSNETTINLDASSYEHAIQLIINGKVADTLRFRTGRL